LLGRFADNVLARGILAGASSALVGSIPSVQRPRYYKVLSSHVQDVLCVPASIMASATPAANFRFQNVQASDKYIHSGFFYHPNGADAVIEARLYYGKLASSAQLPPQLRHGFV